MSQRLADITAMLLGIAFVALAASIVLLDELPGERAMIDAVVGLRSDPRTAAVQAVTFLTSAAPALVVCIIGSVIEVRRHGMATRSFWPLAVYFGHLACNVALRVLIGRMRPDIDYIPHLLPEFQASFQQFSFPSGHAGSAVAAWGSLAIVLRNTSLRTVAALVACLLIGGTSFGRIYLGVHWPSDVLGGLLLSSAWLLIGSSATLRRR